ncbi:3-hydroxybutyryl-CoA dehydrogenase [Peribacillus frigoritolerans]|jgi:3-hydroxybutyryl-CoA dehydrogenase|uniref:3-hydroxyacyl-CoA dehydrogenase family protein n=1 Tax=Peribacillus frigoritolerans TaxID=450367 RepID=UPI000BBA1F16|nr:3-hydroxyacyl-CoA dehydrogenase family protein [Peribacillus frigoritolerans]MCP1493482.1 3-hydroxybutyryl-CoA dehydrogenase [Peribacillus frigoritolerans]PCD06365.1 3-hydroxybutyryl-CoA dehydrogenase [Peribacillus simplex]
MIKKVAIIGSGVMGSGIAQSFAVSGYLVTINDIKEELLYHAQNRIAENLSLLIEEGAMTDREKQGALANITYSVDLEGAVRDADFIIEAIPEVIELKLNLYQQLEEIIKPDAIVASNTSTFPISQLMEKASFAERMVITHFFNPGHLVPLVEIVQHDETKPEIVKTTMDLMRKIGKSPILLKKEIAGFIANRLQTALMREAFYLLKEGVADAEDIDTAITAGPGFRWAFTGPIEIADFGGLDTWQRVFDNVSPVLDQSKEAPDLIRDLVAEGKLGTKSGEGIFTYEESTVSQKINERDRQFIKLGKLKMEKEEVL